MDEVTSRRDCVDLLREVLTEEVGPVVIYMIRGRLGDMTGRG
jgi:hypothetical protein